MDLEKRIIAFVRLGEVLRRFDTNSTNNPILKEAAIKASQKNGWFTGKNILLAFASLGEMLREEKIRKWISEYNIPSAPPDKSGFPFHSNLQRGKEKRVGVIMAGNIPLVGFHDFLCVLMSGNTFVGKLSSKDGFLLPSVANILTEIEPEFEERIIFATAIKGEGIRSHVPEERNKSAPFMAGGNRASGASAFIATGSNNGARYFEYYFAKYPHIIRKNRNAIAILDGNETEADLKNLGKDIFQYFGMGCRNVSKIYIPTDYNLDKFFSAIVDFEDVINHNKYYNNHIYYRTIYLLNKEIFLDNNFLILKESPSPTLPEGKGANISLSSPIATLYYEYYKDQKDLTQKLLAVKEQIQCIASKKVLPFGKDLGWASVPFGNTQSPELWDYADGVDTMKFLTSLPH